MGKDLKGRELGEGISQRKSDSLYSARFTSKQTGKVVQKYFPKLSDCKKWLIEAKYNDEHGTVSANENMTVETWFNYWIENVGGIKENTILSYKRRFRNNIKPIIGNKPISNVKPLHCQELLNAMSNDYGYNTIKLVRCTLKVMFQSAVENEVISKNPITKSIKIKGGKEVKIKKPFTVEEQRKFMKASMGMDYHNQFSFLLQTGLRTGELTGLEWKDIDFANKTLHIRRTMDFNTETKEWRTGDTKSVSGDRVLFLTDEAISILRNQQEKVKHLKIVNMEFKDKVFISRAGEPIKNNTYDSSIKRICQKAQIDDHFSMHSLRHTFATRCIEGGMKPKTLQTLMGHKDISITMNLYVHTSDEAKKNEVEKVAQTLKVV